MIALIDGDSIPYILAWQNKEHRNVEAIAEHLDAYLEDIFAMTGAEAYYGALAHEEVKSFRYQLYKVKPYKGTRKENDENVKFWKPIIRERLKKIWGFVDHPGVEADDLIGMAAKEVDKTGEPWVICSPDKDMKQVTGLHYDYSKMLTVEISPVQALYQFYYLMICGDDSDNVLGLPGAGDKKAIEKLRPLLEAEAPWGEFNETVLDMYLRHFGPYYGDLIFKETFETIALKTDFGGMDIEILPTNRGKIRAAMDKFS